MNFTHKGGWTGERVAQLTDLWAAGLSCSQIAFEMGGGLTRNAVIGKVHRIHLPARRIGINPHGKRFSTATKKATTPKPKRPKMVLISKAPLPPAEPFPFSTNVWEPLAGTTPISLLQLSDEVCRWQVGGTHVSPGTGFCGCPVKRGKVYCPEHHARSVGKGTPSERVAIRSARVVMRYDDVQKIREVA